MASAGGIDVQRQSWSDAILDRCGEMDIESRAWARAILDLYWLTAAARNPGWPVIRARWEVIYRETTAGDRLGSVDLFVTRNVLKLGWFLATGEGRFREAADLLASIFAHPQMQQAHWYDACRLRGELAYTLLMAGDEEQAVVNLRLLIDSPDHVRPALREAETALRLFLGLQDRAVMASEGLTDTVQEVVHRLKRRKVKRWVPESKSCGELMQLLHSIIPAKERERAIAEARSRQQVEHA